mmetsp:Transcript_44744/g.103504  ORF Transcript_44744/g.103504 Transcript_44744/m.103504 type:complete len:691 (-) Transcript_44744:271-2343(-)
MLLSNDGPSASSRASNGFELQDNMAPATSVRTYGHLKPGFESPRTEAHDVAPGTEDLQAICMRAPTLPAVRSQLSHTMIHAMGSVLRRVGSTLRLDDLNDFAHHDALHRSMTPPACSPSIHFEGLPARQSSRGLTPVKTMPADLSKLDPDQQSTQKGLHGLGMQRRHSRLPPSHWAVQSHGLRGLNLGFLLEAQPSLVELQKQRIDQLASPLLVGHREGSSQSLATGLGSLDDESLLEAEALQPETFRGSILDFEHFFVQFYVELRPRASPISSRMWHLWHFPSSWRRSTSSESCVRTLPSADEVAAAWRECAVTYIWENRGACEQRWPSVRLHLQEIQSQMATDLTWQDELNTSKSRVVLTLVPESVCHRLLWAVGDAIPATNMLSSIQRRLRADFPHCCVRCADDLIYPPSFFRLLTLLLLAIFMQCCSLLWRAYIAANTEPIHPRKHVGPTHGELLDQLAARLLLTGSVGQLLMLQVVAATFPLRSLHTPFQRDLGCLMAYSVTAQWLCRLMGPAMASAMPLAMMLRFRALGLPILPTISNRFSNAVALGTATSLPAFTLAAVWSVRSSLYSHHHLLMLLLFITYLGAAVFFATSLEMVKWAVFMASAIVVAAFYLFSRYITEFTSVSLHKAAQLQWTCAHMVPALGILLAAALEVESGMARMLMDYICASQSVIPYKVCLRLLSNA